MNLTPATKAQAIAAAIYTTTGIQAQVLQRPGRPPLVTFDQANRKAATDYLRKSIAQKSDVEIDTLPVVLPLVVEKSIVPAAVILASTFFLGYIIAKI